jgi:glycosyltransferase involved in cell wall biosynthesis
MVNTKPIVSVIVPNYNHARFLPKRIDSILGQSFQDSELILLDDCSTDGSRSILSRYAGGQRTKIEFNDKNSGSPFKQWNKGVGLATFRCKNGAFLRSSYTRKTDFPTLIQRFPALLLGRGRARRYYSRGLRCQIPADVDQVIGNHA